LEESRKEAAGGLEEKTISTEWHAELNVPIKIVEPNKIKVFEYDAYGRLLSETNSQNSL